MAATLTSPIDVSRDELPTFYPVESYALVQDAHMLSVWETYEEAIEEGYRLFGMEPFSIRQIQSVGSYSDLSA